MSHDALTPLQRAFLALEKTRAKLDSLERARREPIAVVGIGCRTPADGDGPGALWDLLRSGRDAVGPVPADRWDRQRVYSSDPDAPGRTVARDGGFLSRVDGFDPELFGISHREAQGMDPQQRLVLEVAWEALENAALAPDRMHTSRTGVYLGIASNDYLHLLLHADDPGLVDAHFMSGIAHSIASGRLSYLLGLQGPSLSIDTACSSSLVAVHLACQALRAGECESALAGGVNVMLSPDISIAYSRARLLSPDGRCKTFDAGADGIARGEGCGIVVLRRLTDAIASGDRILALIRGSAVNQDGPSSGLTAPNGPAQEAVIREALHRAGVEPAAVGYVEAHGTGTPLGDPLEMQALGAVFGGDDRSDRPLHVGSLKTNFGHLEAAAGVMGLIKVVLSLGHREIPPHLHFHTPSPHIEWDELPVTIPTDTTPWPETDGTRVGGVSSFGFSGTNTHIVLEQAPDQETSSAAVERPLHLLTLSAQTEAALRRQAKRLSASIADRADEELGDVAYTLNVGRAALPERAAFTAATIAEARAHLDGIAEGVPGEGVGRARVVAGVRPRVAFLFTGQGAQYVGMGRGLYESSPVFRAALDECAARLDPLLPRPLLEVLYSSDATQGQLDRTGFAQPALFALEYALAVLWRTWGVEPAAVLGHSVGEVTAACIAGVLSLADAAQLIAARGRHMQSLPAGGGMRVVFAPVEKTEALLAEMKGTLEVAGINGPAQTVVSGPLAALDRWAKSLGRAGVKSKALKVSHAFHSALMEPALGPFRKDLADLRFDSPRLRLVSNLTGETADADAIRTAEYWSEHIRRPVRFAAGMETLAGLQCEAMLEIGPTPTLITLGRDCIGADAVAWCASLRSGRDDWEQILGAVRTLFLLGASIDWEEFDRDYARRKLDLPTYPFQRSRIWFQARPSAGRHYRDAEDGNHPLLGRRLVSPLPETQFEAWLLPDRPAFIGDHVAGGVVLLPGMASIELGLAAAREVFGEGEHSVEDLVLHEAMIFDAECALRVQTIVTVQEGDTAAFRVQSIAEGADDWTFHTEGRIRVGSSVATPVDDDPLSAVRARCDQPMEVEELYEAQRRQGYDFGPRLHGVVEVQRGDGEAFGEIALPTAEESEAARYGIHPALLDACMQVLGGALPSAGDGPAENGQDAVGEPTAEPLYLPVMVRRFVLLRPLGTRCVSHVRLEEGSRRGMPVYSADVRIFDSDGEFVAVMEGLRLQRVASDALTRLAPRTGRERMLHQVRWVPKPMGRDDEAVDAAGITHLAGAHLDELADSIPALPRAWVVMGDEGGIAPGLVTALTALGDRCLTLTPSVEDSAEQGTDGAGNQSEIRELTEGPYQDLVPLRPGPAIEAHRAALRICRERFGSRFGIIDLRWLDVPLWDSRVTAADALKSAVTNALALTQATVHEFADAPPRMWMVTRGAQPAGGVDAPLSPFQGAAWGFGRTLALEHPEVRPVRVDLDPSVDAEEIAMLVAELGADGSEGEVAFRGSERRVARIGRREPPERLATREGEENYRLIARERGTLDRLERVECDRRAPGVGEVEVEVFATGLNFRDVLNVLGMYPGDPGPPGGECAGRVTRLGPGVEGLSVGERVVATGSACFSRFVIARSEMVQRIPNDMTSVEAAGIPIAYLTAAYTLLEVGHLGSGERVLIHAAAGGVGLAAVYLAQRAGAEVFATAGSPQKRAYLRSLGVRHVFDSRRTTFATEILAMTDGRGVDVVLNSLSGKSIEEGLRATRAGGRFLEIGKRDIWSAEQVADLDRGLSYHVLDVGTVTDADPATMGRVFLELMEDVHEGVLPPLPVTTFTLESSVEAFRYMMQARHIGKIVVVHEDDPERTSRGTEVTNGVGDRLPVRADGTYLVTGGLSGLGLLVARRLVEWGARHLVLVSRRGVTAEADPALAEMRAAGATVRTEPLDVADEESLSTLLGDIRAQGPALCGVVHAAGLLDDGVLLAQDWSRFEHVFAPKVVGGRLLDRMTRRDVLDWFVVFSSAAAIIGSPGQANHAAANALLDVLAHERRRLGRNAQSINWGPWSEVGAAADLSLQARLEAQGMRTMAPDEGLALLGDLLVAGDVQTGAMVVDWEKWGHHRGPQIASYLSEATVSSSGATPASPPPPSPGTPSLQGLLDASPASRWPVMIAGFVRATARRVLGLPETAALDDRAPLSELGLDSLLAVELRNALGKEVRTGLPATLLFDYPTVEALAGYLTLLEGDGAAETGYGDQRVAAQLDEADDLLSAIEALTDEQADHLTSGDPEK